MGALILSHEASIRLGFYLGILTIVALAEILKPRRRLLNSRSKRWPSNLGIVVFNTLLLRMVLPITALTLAVIADERGWGFFNWVHLPPAIEILAALVLLDLIIYWQHVILHRVPMLWRMHRMHHADTDFDVTLGSRFHPLEILLSMCVKFSAICALGVAPLAVVLFEIILNGTAMFNHGNIRLPIKLDRVLRYFVVTPDMHRVHHSIFVEETDSNFGFNLPWWDRLFKTYTAQPKAGHEQMKIGLNEFRDEKFLRLDRLFAIPFYKNIRS